MKNLRLILRINKRRILVVERGWFMNIRYAIYDNKGILEVWFSDKQRALEWWAKNKHRETYYERRDKELAELRAKMNDQMDLDDCEELPFN